MFKMVIEDVFVIRDRGVVATGRVESGTLRVGDTVQVNGGRSVTVDAIEKFRKKLPEATQGENAGLLFRSISGEQLGRGDVLTAAPSRASYGEAPPL